MAWLLTLLRALPAARGILEALGKFIQQAREAASRKKRDEDRDKIREAIEDAQRRHNGGLEP